MGIFSKDEDPNSDEEMIKAIRKRLMDEIGRSSGGSERIVNNVYGSSPSGLVDRLYQDKEVSGDAGEDDPYEYMVDIDREDKLNEAGEKIGWNKRVHRYRDKKKVKTM